MNPMLIKILFLIFAMSACIDKGGQKTASDKGSAFEKKVKSLSQTELDTTYARICRHLEKDRKALGKKWKAAANETEKQAVLADARKLLLTSLADSVFVCWYGTGWDFNGTSTCPGKGNVACGYFVTTTLKQSGFDINRAWLAQQASSVMIDTFCPKDKVKIITNNQTQKLFDYINGKPDGIFLLGLDNHTGFIVKKNGKANFVHSSYLSTVDKVVSEPLEKSKIILANNYFVVGNLSQSDETIRKWITGEKIGS